MQKKRFAVEDKELSATKSFAALFDAARKTSAYEAEARELEPMKNKKPSKVWWIVYPVAVTLEVISNKCRFGEWRFKAAHRTFKDGITIRQP